MDWLRRTYLVIYRPGGSSTSAFVVNVDARRPADTTFHRRPRFPCGCGADMEQLADISSLASFRRQLKTELFVRSFPDLNSSAYDRI